MKTCLLTTCMTWRMTGCNTKQTGMRGWLGLGLTTQSWSTSLLTTDTKQLLNCWKRENVNDC